MKQSWKLWSKSGTHAPNGKTKSPLRPTPGPSRSEGSHSHSMSDVAVTPARDLSWMAGQVVAPLLQHRLGKVEHPTDEADQVEEAETLLPGKP